VLRLGPIQIDRSACEVRRSGILIDLTPTEFRVLNALASNIGYAHTREEIIGQVSPDGKIYDRTLDRHIANLRQKIEDLPARPRIIVTVVGVGYKLVDPVGAASGAGLKTRSAQSTIHDIRNYLCAAMAVIEVLADGRMEPNAVRLNGTLQALQEVDALIDELATSQEIGQETRVRSRFSSSTQRTSAASSALRKGLGRNSTPRRRISPPTMFGPA
jgi:DNA-binding winged helix-turn-helix (wHTH) protein